MKTILIVFSFQLLMIIGVASAFNVEGAQKGIKDWSQLTAKQFR